MVAQGIVATTKDAFTRYLHDGGPGDAGGHRLHIGDVLATGRAAGAKLALAHPHLLGERAAPLLRRHRADGLDGIEAHYGAYDSAQRSRWARLATELELVCTAGSDRHTDGDPELGIDLDPPATDRLLRWLGR
jgi:predicted metal-dependent phosphoesterase TrpH